MTETASSARGCPAIAAVVVTYHRPLELRQVVESLLGQTHPPDHIIILDNGGPVRANEILAEHADALIIIHSVVNLGGAGGFARGLSEGLGLAADWVWLLDDDAVPEADALEQLLLTIPKLPANAGVLGCAVMEFGDVALRHRRRFNRRTGWETSVPLSSYGKSPVEIDTCSFVGFLVRAEAARQIPLPAADFFLAYDDTDYSLRLQDAGWRLWLVPDSVVVHLRTSDARLGTSPFGSKHYLNIRNRLIVKRGYAQFRLLATVDGIAYGLMLWLRAGGWKSAAQHRLLLGSLRDGIAEKLGPAPAQQVTTLTPKSWAEAAFSRGVIIIRTQGQRPQLLLEAIHSVRDQTNPLSVVLVVHGDSQAFSAVSKAMAEEVSLGIKILHAPDLSRTRGYPLNVGLNHVCAEARYTGFVAFLDDDDVLYPRFGAAIADALKMPSTDVVYTASNKRALGAQAEPAYHPLPVACLLHENFIPINAYAVRIDSLRAHGVKFDESLEVLEDWNFLHRLLGHSFRFTPLSEYLSEFRLTGDGNTPDKQDQAMWDRAWEGVHDYLDEFWQSADGGALVAGFFDFDFSSRPPLTADEQRRLNETKRLLCEHYPAEVSLQLSQRHDLRCPSFLDSVSR